MSRGPRARTVINQTYPEVDCLALQHEARYRHFVIETTVVDALSRLGGSLDYRDRSAIKEESSGHQQTHHPGFQKQVLGANGRVVVDFYADWCGPCRWDESVPFVKVDIDESPRLAQKYGVFSIPTIILFDNGEVAAQTMGARPAAAIERELGLANDYASPGDDQHVRCCP